MKSLEQTKHPEASKLKQLMLLKTELGDLLVNIQEDQQDISKVTPALSSLLEIIKKLDDLNLGKAFLDKIIEESHKEENLEKVDINIKIAEIFEAAGKTITSLRKKSSEIEELIKDHDITNRAREIFETAEIEHDALADMGKRDEQRIKDIFVFLGEELPKLLELLKLPVSLLVDKLS